MTSPEDDPTIDSPPPLFRHDGADRFIAQPIAAGPWSAEALHGGPVAALLADQLTRLPAENDFHPARFTLELRRPVPVGLIHVAATVTRPGRRVRLLTAEAVDPDGRLLAVATLQQIRIDPDSTPSAEPRAVTRPLPPEETTLVDFGWPASNLAFHADATEHRTDDPGLKSMGPGREWIRVTAPLFEGVPLDPFQRAVAASDFVNGISRIVPFDQFTFINPDLTVLIHRLPQGQWVHLDAHTTSHGDGHGIAQAVLSDELGPIGTAAQTLLIAPR